MKKSIAAKKNAEKQEGIDTAVHWRAVNTALNQQDVQNQIQQNEETRALANDWHFQKKKTDRVEADLNPKFNKLQPINPDYCGISSCQKFAGEDLNGKERNRMQSTKIRQWCDQQLAFKKEQEEAEKVQEKEAVEVSKIIDNMRLQNEKENNLQEKNTLYDVQLENRLLAKEKRLEKKLLQMREQQINQWEVENAKNNPILCENSNAYGTNGRVRRDHWKGMSQQEINEIHRSNVAIAMAQKENSRLDKEEDQSWAAFEVEINSGMDAHQREEEAERVSELYELKNDLRHQKKDHRNREKFLKKQLGEGAVDNKFYSQFGYKDCNCRKKSDLLVKNPPPIN